MQPRLELDRVLCWMSGRQSLGYVEPTSKPQNRCLGSSRALVVCIQCLVQSIADAGYKMKVAMGDPNVEAEAAAYH